MGSPLLFAGLGALFIALVVALTALTGGGGARGAVTRTLRTAGRGYRVAPATVRVGGRPRGGLPRQAGQVGRALTQAGAFDSLNRRLDQAGNPAWLGIEAVLAYKGLLLFVGVGVALLLAVLFAGPLGAVVLVVLGAAAGFFGPDLLVLHLAQLRQEEIRRTLPDILDTLVVTVEAGLGFEAALAQVVRNGRGPMVGEFARVLHAVTGSGNRGGKLGLVHLASVAAAASSVQGCIRSERVRPRRGYPAGNAQSRSCVPRPGIAIGRDGSPAR